MITSQCGKINRKQIIKLFSFTLWALVVTVLNYCVEGYLYNIFQYLLIVSCFVFALINVKNKRFNFLIALGLGFTLMADYCLVLSRPMLQSLGTTFFLITQIVYGVKLICENEKRTMNSVHIITRIIGSVAVVIIALVVLKSKIDYLSIVSVLYLWNLIVNIIFAVCDCKNQILFLIGLIFFIGCDVLVGLSAADGIYFTIESGLINSILHCGVDVAWILYRPSQYLIAVSTLKLKNNYSNC